MKPLLGHWQLIVITALVFALWGTPVVTPLKILIVFFHEVSHAMAALFTGGSVERIVLFTNQGGFAETRGGSVAMIYTAGYLGSLMIGVLLFVLAVRTDKDRIIMGALGVGLMVITALYTRNSFGLGFGLAVGGLMILLAYKFSSAVSDLTLRVIGLSSMIYAPYDIVSDTLLRVEGSMGQYSDAYQFASVTFGSGKMWGVIWLLVSLLVIGVCLRFGLGERSNIGFKRKQL